MYVNSSELRMWPYCIPVNEMEGIGNWKQSAASPYPLTKSYQLERLALTLCCFNFSMLNAAAPKVTSRTPSTCMNGKVS